MSYLYLKELNKIYILVMMFLTFIAGTLEIINFNTNISDYIYLVVGISNLLVTVIFNKYNELRLLSHANAHYHYYKTFDRLMLNINNNVDIQDSDAFLYKNIHAYIKQVNYEIDIIFLKRNKFPEKILSKYQINKTNISLSNNRVTLSKKKKSAVFDINKSFNFIEMEPINESDKLNYQKFLDEIEKINIQEIQNKNESLIHFKTIL